VSRRKNSGDELRATLTEALLRDVGISERMSAPIIDSVMRCFAGQQPYFPAPERDATQDRIAEMLAAGKSVKQVGAALGLSRSQVHRRMSDCRRDTHVKTDQNSSR
jgi:DNA-binding NarL/FixJ family response regulator